MHHIAGQLKRWGPQRGFLDTRGGPYNERFENWRQSAQWGCQQWIRSVSNTIKRSCRPGAKSLLKSIARTEEEGRSADDDPTVDLADKAANSYTKEFLFGQNNTDRTTLQLIDEALDRIKNNTYGICENCETELQQKRLEAVPWARHCTSLPGETRTGPAVNSTFQLSFAHHSSKTNVLQPVC